MPGPSRSFVACCAWRPAPALLLGSAALAGAFTPPLIATARAVWPEVSGPGLAGTGHALNAALGDAAQVVGPAVTGAVAALASPLLALGLLIPGAATGALILSRTGVGSAAPRRPMAHRVWGALRESAGLRTVVVCELALGVWLGAFEVGAAALAGEDGAPELAALPLAVFGAGSVIASLWSGTGRLRRPAGWRCVGGAIGLAAVFLAPLATPSLSAFAAIAAVGGGCFGVITVALFELIDEVVASTRAIEALTWITSAQGAGVAGGAAAAGRVSIEGAWNALLVVAISAVACALIAAGRRATLAVAVPR